MIVAGLLRAGICVLLLTHQADVAGLEHRIYIQAAHAAADELCVLRAIIKHQAHAVLLVQFQHSFVLDMIGDNILLDRHPVRRRRRKRPDSRAGNDCLVEQRYSEAIQLHALKQRAQNSKDTPMTCDRRG